MYIRKFEEKDRESSVKIFEKYWNDHEFLEELSDEITNNPSKFFVAENNNEIVGIVGYKEVADYLKEFTKTYNPVELYVIASKYKRKGVGKALKLKLIEILKESGFSEILLFSPGTHDSSWEFHDTLGFKRLGEVTPPDDDSGHVWSKVL